MEEQRATKITSSASTGKTKPIKPLNRSKSLGDQRYKRIIDSINSSSSPFHLVEKQQKGGGPAVVLPCIDSVVKVLCVHAKPNFALPWQREKQVNTSSSGYVIEGKRILTNAHSVEYYTQVKIKKRGSDTKYVATVLAIGTECDIGNTSN